MDINQKLVEQTWQELGYKVRPLFAKVFVRTDPPEEKVGSLYLPPKEADFHGGLGHLKIVTATVLSVGPLVSLLKPGDRVCFQRLNFGYIAKLSPGVFVGWIEREQLLGYAEDGSDIRPLESRSVAV